MCEFVVLCCIDTVQSTTQTPHYNMHCKHLLTVYLDTMRRGSVFGGALVLTKESIVTHLKSAYIDAYAHEECGG